MPLSTEKRELIVVWAYNFGLESRDIAELLLCSERTVERVLAQFEATGAIASDQACRRGPAPLLGEVEMAFLERLLNSDPQLHLEEMADQVQSAFGRRVSRATVCRTLQRMGWTAKKLQFRARKCSIMLRLEYAFEMRRYDASRVYFLDECASTADAMRRRRAWAPLGARALVRNTCPAMGRLSVLALLNIRGIVSYHVTPGGHTSETFVAAVRHMVVRLLLGGWLQD